MKCLLIIDMQKGLFTPDTPRYNSREVVKNINKLSQSFRKKGFPVIFIQHNGESENIYIPRSKEWEILDDLIIEKSDLIIEKYANDSFYKSKLEITLKELKVEELFFTGCATDFCVNSTLQSAYTKNFQITVVSDGHTTGDRPHIGAKAVIDYFHWLWENMISINRKIGIKSTDNILYEL